ncbi:hypothetical protein VKT23_008273 [Stygiomarasmius scandens]|uniref:Uncharacterized protein n=1 Tax=Marasmiellus scandens TaxID=2682957 RepID=A0ABR1JK91_9AGAR
MLNWFVATWSWLPPHGGLLRSRVYVCDIRIIVFWNDTWHVYFYLAVFSNDLFFLVHINTHFPLSFVILLILTHLSLSFHDLLFPAVRYFSSMASFAVYDLYPLCTSMSSQ